MTSPTHPVRSIAELRAVLAHTADTTLVMLPASVVRAILDDRDAARVALADMHDGLADRGA